ncbi:MAG: YidC/Oxa1 family membrane protein insertase [Actinomycetes bacterium]
MFEGFFDLLGSVLNFFYSIVPFQNLKYGLSIMLLTVLVMIVITPLTVKSTKSMLQMQRLQPEMKRIQTQYKDDREKQNAALMEFYKENQINPLGGCLPVLVQMPVFIVMYQLLRGLTARLGGMGSGAGHVIAQSSLGEKVTPWISTQQDFRPVHLNETTELYQSLSKTSRMGFLGMDLSLSASQVLKTGLLLTIPYFALLLIMLVTGIYQNKQLQSRNTAGNVNPQQQAIMKAMPFFLPVFSFGFPAGLALYWCTQNLCRIGTNAYITRSLYGKEQESGVVETTAKETTKPAKGQAKGKDQQGSQKSLPAKSGSSGNPGKKGGTKPAAPRGPGKSAKSQAAHSKKSGGSSSPRPSGTSGGRKSGEPRGGTDKKKG